MDICKKCYIVPDYPVATVDLNAVLCNDCLDLFWKWADEHTTEPYQNFLQPKPWDPKLYKRDWPEVLDMTDETV